ncbi:MAG TPA: hypothetical protein VI431_14045, partial [Candidatus Acidoferrum sp.]
MLAAGRGTPKDLPAAYFWIFAAELQGEDRREATLRVLETQLTSAEVEEAKVRAQSLIAARKSGAVSSSSKLAVLFEP